MRPGAGRSEDSRLGSAGDLLRVRAGDSRVAPSSGARPGIASLERALGGVVPSGRYVRSQSACVAVPGRSRGGLEYARPRAADRAGWCNRRRAATKLAGFEEALADLRVIALETVAAPGIDRIERVYLIQSLMAFEGDRVWGRSLDCLSDGGADVSCPKCGSDFSFEISGGTNPCPPEEMPEPGRRLRGYALEAGDAELARNLCELFGTVECPACGEVCSTPKAIAAMCRSY